jgi:hypothetical protein
MIDEQGFMQMFSQMLSEYVKANDLPPWEKLEFNAPTKATGFTIYTRRTDDPDALLDHLDDKIALCVYVNRRLAGEVVDRPKLHSPFVLTDDMDDDMAFRSAADFLKGGSK